MKYGIIFTIGLMILGIFITEVFSGQFAALFNAGSSREYFVGAMRIISISFLFAGINIFCSSALSAIASVKWAFVLSILKGFVVVNVCAAILAPIFGMNGVWVAFPLSEFILLIISGVAMKKSIGALESEK